jgi:hypothetical protein
VSAELEACGSCGNVHTPTTADELIERCSDRINRGEPLMLAQADDLVSIARCLHSQLYAAHADQHNYGLEIQRLQAENAHFRHVPGGRVEESGSRFAVRCRDGKIIESPAPDLAVSRFDNMNAQAVELGFDSAEAEVVRRNWAIYVEDWKAVSPAEIEQYRVDHWDEPPF